MERTGWEWREVLLKSGDVAGMREVMLAKCAGLVPHLMNTKVSLYVFMTVMPVPMLQQLLYVVQKGVKDENGKMVALDKLSAAKTRKLASQVDMLWLPVLLTVAPEVVSRMLYKGMYDTNVMLEVMQDLVSGKLPEICVAYASEWWTLEGKRKEKLEELG